MNERYDVIIVGTGAAGLYCALNLPDRIRTLIDHQNHQDFRTRARLGDKMPEEKTAKEKEQ